MQQSTGTLPRKLKESLIPVCESKQLQYNCSELYLVIFGIIHGLNVGILGTKSPKYIQVKGLQTGSFKGS